ncbi:MAG TPA: alpha/beta hydrolase [Dehalococcoidia bacterium]|nr:alpha/beta hydrolase [Dehalococcoidia bacterium]
MAAAPAVRDEYVDLRGLRLHYRDWQTPAGGGRGRPLVMLHGLASNARIWDLTAPLLAERFRVLAADQRGHGLSDKPEGTYGFDEVTGDLSALIAALGLERPLVVGHSWGGNVALQFAADCPDDVCGLVLVDGGFLEIASFEGMTWERTQRLMAPPPLDGMKVDAFLKAARLWPELAPLWSDQVQEIVLANFEVRDDGSIRPHLSRERHLRILRALWEQRPSQLWRRVRCPALLIPAARDNPDPRNAMWMKGKRRALAVAERESAAVRVLWLEDTIHDVPLQRPQELAEAIAEFGSGLT